MREQDSNVDEITVFGKKMRQRTSNSKRSTRKGQATCGDEVGLTIRTAFIYKAVNSEALADKSKHQPLIKKLVVQKRLRQKETFKWTVLSMFCR